MADKLKVADLRETLESAEKELVTLSKRVEVLKEWIAVTKRLCSKNSKLPASLEAATVVTRSRRTKTSDLAQQVAEVLLEHGAPMHIKEIVRALADKGHPMTARNPVATLAVALSRRTQEFQRTAPNTFGLASVAPQAVAATIAS
jgi:hypothetical protein